MTQGAVSVVIPVYNNQPYVASAVRSVLAQTRPPEEVIVVDDGSIDSTAEALEPCRASIHYVFQQNRGEPAARNRGIQEAHGEYIAFLDGDDLWLPNKLELQMEYLREHPSCSLVYTDMSTFDEHGIIDASVKDRFRMTLPTGRIFPSLFMRSLFGSGSVVFRKNCLDKVGYFDEDLLVGSDYEMWLRISRHFELGVVDRPLLKYRHHAAMSTRGLGLKMCNGVPWEVAVLSKILRLYPEAIDEIGQSVVNRRLSRPYLGLVYNRFRQRDYRSARPLLRKAIGYWPTNPLYWMLFGTTFLPPAHISAARKMYRKLTRSQTTDNTRASEVTST
jgi:glycosyltransferase involved in cell wall biosynthesis